MIDIHTHILPGVDDGASEVNVTAAMLAMAQCDGIQAIIATPHANQQYSFDPFHNQAELRRVRTLCPVAPNLHLGCELNITPENLHAAMNDPSGYTLNGKDCLLVELPESFTPQAIDFSLQLLIEAGFRPIIAHPERNGYIQRHPKYAKDIVSLGCFMQLTASSLFGSFGKRAEEIAELLLNGRMAHFVASDAHGVDNRRPLLKRAYERIAKNYGEATASLLLLENPLAVIDGTSISQISQSRRSKFSLFFFGRSSLSSHTEQVKDIQRCAHSHSISTDKY